MELYSALEAVDEKRERVWSGKVCSSLSPPSLFGTSSVDTGRSCGKGQRAKGVDAKGVRMAAFVEVLLKVRALNCYGWVAGHWEIPTHTSLDNDLRIAGFIREAVARFRRSLGGPTGRQQVVGCQLCVAHLQGLPAHYLRELYKGIPPDSEERFLWLEETEPLKEGE
jgi:hypothetical protein